MRKAGAYRRARVDARRRWTARHPAIAGRGWTAVGRQDPARAGRIGRTDGDRSGREELCAITLTGTRRSVRSAAREGLVVALAGRRRRDPLRASQTIVEVRDAVATARGCGICAADDRAPNAGPLRVVA